MKANLKNFGWVLLLACLALSSPAQNLTAVPSLARDHFRDGEETLRAFAPVSETTRDSVVEVNVDGDAVALGAVVDNDGLVLTKASEIKAGKLTCWLASGREVPAQWLAVDDDDDVALLHLPAKGLKPIRWATETATVGEWAITPGLAETPQAAGIISASPRKIRPKHAFMGVMFKMSNPIPEIESVEPGMGADKAGLKPGDIIAQVNDTVVTNRDQVIDIISDFREGQSVKVNVERGGRPFETNVILTSPTTGRFALQLYFEREENRLSGEISERSLGFDEAIEHDTVLAPWMCGGPLVDLDGRALGLNIARASRVATYALPASLARQILRQLKISAHLPQKPGDSNAQ